MFIFYVIDRRLVAGLLNKQTLFLKQIFSTSYFSIRITCKIVIGSEIAHHKASFAPS